MLWQVGGVVDSVVELGSSSISLVVYRREEGGRNSKYNANISMTMRDMTMSGARGVLTRQQVVSVKGGNIREVFPMFHVFGQTDRRGKVASSIG